MGKVGSSVLEVAGREVVITNPDKTFFPQAGYTKLDVASYYDSVGKLMMPHLRGRPVSLVRALAGVTGPLFFQKHAEVEKLPGIEQLDVALDLPHPPMLGIVDALDMLVSAPLRPPWSGVSRSPRHTGPSRGRNVRKG